MPKTDYSNTIIYEIKCKDPQVKYYEIGATTNLSILRHRFFKLKIETKFPNLIQQITANGGIDNWEVNELESYDSCSSKSESNIRVEYWKKHKLELSKSPPKVIQILQNSSSQNTNLSKSTGKKKDVFRCFECDCEYSTKGNYDKHLLTVKHKNAEISAQKDKKMDNKDKNGKNFATLTVDSFTCEYCNNTYSNSFNLKRHKLRCKVFVQQKDEANKKYEEAKKMKEMFDDDESDTTALTTHTNSVTTMNNSNNTVNNIVNNNTIINNNVNVSYRVQLGSEPIANLLTDNDKKQVLSKIHGSLLYYVHKVHFSGQYPEYLNVALTNLRSKYAHKYSEIEEKFITELADNVFTEMIDTRFSEICDFYDERKTKLNAKMESRLNNYIEGMKNNPEKYKKTMDDVMLLAYNNRDKVKMDNCVNMPEPLQIQNEEE
jgi:hypothetical protein